MTGRELHISLEKSAQTLDKRLIFEDKKFSSVYYNYLNKAQNLIVDELYNKGISRTESETRALSILIKRAAVQNISATVPLGIYGDNDIEVDIDVSTNDSKRVLNEYVYITEYGKYVEIIPISYDFYMSNRNNPYKKPSENEIWRLIANDRHILILPSGVSPTNYYYEYLLNPVDITSTTVETADILHKSYHNILLEQSLALFKNDYSIDLQKN